MRVAEAWQQLLLLGAFLHDGVVAWQHCDNVDCTHCVAVEHAGVAADLGHTQMVNAGAVVQEERFDDAMAYCCRHLLPPL